MAVIRSKDDPISGKQKGALRKELNDLRYLRLTLCNRIQAEQARMQQEYEYTDLEEVQE
jgi:hypothetical protein